MHKSYISICFLLFVAVTLQAQNLKMFKADNNKYGFKDEKGNIAIQPKYDGAKGFFDGLAAVNIGGTPDLFRTKGGKWGYVNNEGKEIIPLVYDEVGNFSEGLVATRIDYQWNIIDKTGKTIVKGLNYAYIGSFKEGLAVVCRNTGVRDEWGYIDSKGKEVIPVQYKDALSFSNGKARVTTLTFPETKIYIDKTGKEIK